MIVSEGFSGNIAFKAAEGTARQMFDFAARCHVSRAGWSRIGYLFARGAFQKLRDKLDPNKSNGGMLLGLKGVVVKSHGGINAEGFAYAVDVGYEMARCDLLTKINQMLNRDGSAGTGADRAGGCLVTAIRSVVLGCGSYLPERVLTNAELASRIDTSDDWIVQRTGIRERHIAADGEFTSHLAIKAARAALARCGPRRPVDRPDRAGDLDAGQHLSGHRGRGPARARHQSWRRASICRRCAPDSSSRSTTADNFLRAGAYKRALVIGAETFSRILDWSDRGTCVLFGDGAGAVVLEAQAAARHDRPIAAC